MSDGLRGLVSHYNQRVAAIAAKLSTYQITQEQKVSLFPNRGPPSYFSKDWVFVERTEDIDDFSPYGNISIKIRGGHRVYIGFCQALFHSSYFVDIIPMFDESLPSITCNVRPPMPTTRLALVTQNLPVVS